MKQKKLSMLMVLALAGPVTALAEQPGVAGTDADAAVPGSAVAEPAQAEAPRGGHGPGMMHRGGCGHKGGKGMHGGGHHGKHAEVVQRLDLIEARLAKIELMLESLMKHR